MTDTKTPYCGVAIPNPDPEGFNPWLICRGTASTDLGEPTMVRFPSSGSDQVVVRMCESHAAEGEVLHVMPAPRGEGKSSQTAQGRTSKKRTRKSTAADRAAADKLEEQVKS